jgi:hypothetical protein
MRALFAIRKVYWTIQTKRYFRYRLTLNASKSGDSPDEKANAPHMNYTITLLYVFKDPLPYLPTESAAPLAFPP